MQIVFLGDNLHKLSTPIFWKNKKKIFQIIVCWNFYPAYRSLIGVTCLNINILSGVFDCFIVVINR